MKSKAPRARGKSHIVAVFSFAPHVGKVKQERVAFSVLSWGGWLAREEIDSACTTRYYLIPIGEGTLADPANPSLMDNIANSFSHKGKRIGVELFSNRLTHGRNAGKVVGSVGVFARGEGGEIPAHAKPAALRRAKYRDEVKDIERNALLRRHKTQTEAMAICQQFETMDATALPVCTYIVNGNRLSAVELVDALSVYSEVDAEIDRRAAIKASERQQFNANRELATADSHGEQWHTIYSDLPTSKPEFPQHQSYGLPDERFAFPSIEYPANIWHVCI